MIIVSTGWWLVVVRWWQVTLIDFEGDGLWSVQIAVLVDVRTLVDVLSSRLQFNLLWPLVRVWWEDGVGIVTMKLLTAVRSYFKKCVVALSVLSSLSANSPMPKLSLRSVPERRIIPVHDELDVLHEMMISSCTLYPSVVLRALLVLSEIISNDPEENVSRQEQGTN